ncbi:MAG: hypothetical protein CMB56_001870 [Methanobacteriota archaeon]|nr:MAG: hypothetical protein CMB56_001870 [Euryarchaeota archaeon]
MSMKEVFNSNFKINILSIKWLKNINFQRFIYSLAVIYLSWKFFSHGIRALMVEESFKPLVDVILPTSFVPLVLILVGVIDLSIAFLLIVRNQPVILAYAGLYPLIPMTLKFFVTGDLGLFSKSLMITCASIAFLTVPVNFRITDFEFKDRPYSTGTLVGVVAISILITIASTFVIYFLQNTDKNYTVIDSSDENNNWRPFSVVAPIDTGINVYHDHFRTNETYPQEVLDGLGVNKWCNLTFEGSFSERYEADRDTCWDNLTTSDIVYFPGTKIIGTSPDGETDIHILDDPNDGHGTAVTGAVLDANPDAIIFFVEGFTDAAVLAAAEQPLVDIITTSFGPIGSVPVPGIEDATKFAVVTKKKIHTGASDNTPSPAIQDSTAGPPWSIGISGYAEEGDDQKETMSGSYPDVAADWTQILPNHDDTDGYHETSGTSFATPRTAGLLSKIIQTLRSEFNDFSAGADPTFRNGLLVNGTIGENQTFELTNDDIRNALNLSGWYPSFSTWDPTSGTTPMSPILPCTQVGWGVVNESNVIPMIEHLNETNLIPDRPTDVVTCMNANQQIREAYWT